MLATFLRDVTATFLSVADTYVRTYVRTHIMRIDPGLKSLLRSQLIFVYIFIFSSLSFGFCVVVLFWLTITKPKNILGK